MNVAVTKVREKKTLMVAVSVAGTKDSTRMETGYATSSRYFAILSRLRDNIGPDDPWTSIYSLTHIPTGLKIADRIPDFDTAQVTARAIASIPLPWDSCDQEAICFEYRRLPVELKAWLRSLNQKESA